MIKKKDRSFGVIPLKREGNIWNVFLVRHRAGHWGFPKGHANSGETAIQAALRELREETQLEIVKLIENTPLIENYLFEENRELIDKVVEYFLALVEGEGRVDNHEVLEGAWFSLPKAVERVTFAESKRILEEVKKRVGD